MGDEPTSGGPTDPVPLPPALARLLSACSRRELLLATSAGLAEGLCLLLLGLAGAQAVADLGEGPRRAAAATALALGLLPLLLRIGRRLLTPSDPLRLARRLERAAGLAEAEPLSAAVALAGTPGSGSPWMRARVLALGAHCAAGLDPARLIPAGPIRTRLVLALLALLAVLVLPGAPARLAAAAWPWELPPPEPVLPFALEPFPATVAAGADCELAVRAAEGASGWLELRWDGGGEERQPFSALPGVAGQIRLHARLPAVATGFSWRAVVSGAGSPWRRIELAAGPHLAGISLVVQPPAYAGLPPYQVAGGDAEIHAGSQVTVVLRVAGPCAAAELVLPGGTRAAVPDGDGRLVAFLTPGSSLVYGLRLVGRDPVVAEPPQRYSLNLRSDQPPSVALAVAGFAPADGAIPVGPRQRLPVGLGVEDDLGPPRAWVEVSSRRLPAQRLAAGGAGQAVLDLEALGARPGDHLAVQAVAMDAAGQQAASATVALVVAEGADWRRAAAALALRPHLAALDDQAAALVGQGRTWADLLQREAGPERRAVLALLDERLALWRQAVTTAAQGIMAAGASLPERRDDAVAALLATAGGDLAIWAEEQAGLLARSASAGDPAGRRLCEAARRDLLAARREVGLAAARLAAEALAWTAAGDRATTDDPSAGARLAELPRRLDALANAVGDERVAEAARRSAQEAGRGEAANAAVQVLGLAVASALAGHEDDRLPPRLRLACSLCARHLALATARRSAPGEAGREEALMAWTAARTWAARAADLAGSRSEAATLLRDLATTGAELPAPARLAQLGQHLVQAHRLSVGLREPTPPDRPLRPLLPSTADLTQRAAGLPDPLRRQVAAYAHRLAGDDR